MSIAAAFNTTQIWIVNVGSLKPLEMPTEHFLNLAWDIDAWPINSVHTFLEHWAAREFGEEVSAEVSDIMAKYSVSRLRFPAGIRACLTTTVDVRFEEQGRVGQCDCVLVCQLRRVSKMDFCQYGGVWLTWQGGASPWRMGEHYRACWQGVPLFAEGDPAGILRARLHALHCADQSQQAVHGWSVAVKPVVGCADVPAGRSNQYAVQGRNAANKHAQAAIEYFFNDQNITESFHSLLDRKWDQ